MRSLCTAAGVLAVGMVSVMCTESPHSKQPIIPRAASPPSRFLEVGGETLGLLVSPAGSTPGYVTIDDEEAIINFSRRVAKVWKQGANVSAPAGLATSAQLSLRFSEDKRQGIELLANEYITLDGVHWRRSPQCADIFASVLRYLVDHRGYQWASSALHSGYLTREAKDELFGREYFR